MGINRAGPGVTRRRVVVLLNKGVPQAQIARKLRISRQAVSAHVAVARRSGELTEPSEGAA